MSDNSYIGQLEAAVEQLKRDVAFWNADARRLSGGLLAISGSRPGIPAAVLRSVAYDVALNCIEPDVATYQIERRALNVAEDTARGDPR